MLTFWIVALTVYMRSLHHKKNLKIRCVHARFCVILQRHDVCSIKEHVFKSLKCDRTCLIEHHIALRRFSTFAFIAYLNVPEISVYEIFNPFFFFLQHKVFIFPHVACVMSLSFEMLDMEKSTPGCCVYGHWEKSSSRRSAPP